MVLIPNDIGIRMRMLADSALLQPTAPVQGIPSDLPELRPGQRFSALIRDSLPDNTYRALVAGKELTLSLPAGAKSGDTLELVVIEHSGKAVVAQLANKAPTIDTANPAPYTSLSSVAKLIGQLLTKDGAPPPSAELSRGGPIVQTMTVPSATIAVALASAVEESGLFYESHQAQWISGQRPLAQLLNEPQAHHSDLKMLVAGLLQENGEPPNVALPAFDEKSVGVGRHLVEQGSLTTAYESKILNLAVPQRQHDEPAVRSPPALVATSPNESLASSIPEEIRPLVQQQLDALATQRMIWHGEIWPQQSFDFEINHDGGKGQPSGESTNDQWTTSVRLTLPRLGDLAAKVWLTGDGVRMGIQTRDPLIAEVLRDALITLHDSIEAAGIPVLGALVKHDDTVS